MDKFFIRYKYYFNLYSSYTQYLAFNTRPAPPQKKKKYKARKEARKCNPMSKEEVVRRTIPRNNPDMGLERLDRNLKKVASVHKLKGISAKNWKLLKRDKWICKNGK